MLLTTIFLWVVAAFLVRSFVNNYHRWKHGHPLLFVFALLLPMLWLAGMIGQTKFGESCWGLHWLQQIVYYDAYTDGVFGAHHMMFLVSAVAFALVSGSLWIWIIIQIARLEFMKNFAAGQIPVALIAIGIIAIFSPVGANLKAARIDLQPTQTALARAMGDATKRGIEATSDMANQAKEAAGKPQDSVIIPESVKVRFASATDEGKQD
jgi:hypothetical protein